MKLSTSAIAIMATLLSTTVLANSSKPVVTDRAFGSVFAEYYLPDGDKTESLEWNYLDKGFGYGFELGYNIDETWAVRFEYARDRLEQLISDNKFDADRFGVDALYNIAGTGMYLVGGLKHFEVEGSRDTQAVNIGVGYRHYVGERVSLFAEMNRFQGLTNDSYGDANIKLGVSMLFGSAPAVAEPTPAPEPVQAPVVVVADSDNDGVPDSSDLCPGTPSTDKVDANGCSIFTEKEVNFTLKAQFANDSAEIKPEYSSEIADLAAFLKRFPGTDVEIGGHASNVGGAAYNLKLSERRADAVAKVLLNEHGISANRVTVKGYGVSRPKVEGNTPAAHAANRRIEAVVTATVKEKVER
ncbi:outer membrane protein/peptidoglycan-associated (lipo)protein [Rheinheimera sp. A13L]|uniref:OmpA family protein n=1 Tax=Rheinheimera sp. A13L TaxID=506534 RepID=UPI000212523E|nr:OmpA family protein [Rheinheimera sp. A13L]EGM77416.1 outer membrane protein/peptidoglycan-associated (lipo)protein [Rheinheimera sp. A13L]